MYIFMCSRFCDIVFVFTCSRPESDSGISIGHTHFHGGTRDWRGVVDEEEGVVLSWGQGGGDSSNDPLVISSNDDLEGEDSEVITAFSD